VTAPGSVTACTASYLLQGVHTTDLNTPLPPALGNDALDARGVVGGGVGAALRAVLRGSPTPATSRVSRMTQPRSAMQTSLAYPTWPPGRHR
jgi:hypothetical protein